MSLDKQKALALLADSNVHAVNISTLVNICVRQFELIKRMENEAAQRAIVLGLTLWRIRFSLPHGQWIPWQKESLAYGRTQVSYYMRLSVIFLTTSRTTKVELQALPAALDKQDSLTRAFAQKLEKFVGACSLHELLVKHGIKGVSRDCDEDGEGAKPAASGEQMIFAEISEHLFGFRRVALKRENLAQIPPKQLRALAREWDQTDKEMRRLFIEALGHKAQP